jgi:hypothetical protein
MTGALDSRSRVVWTVHVSCRSDSTSAVRCEQFEDIAFHFCTLTSRKLGVIISKRQIGKALVFANIIPPREGMVVEQMGVSNRAARQCMYLCQ